MRLRPEVRADLERHGILVAAGDTPAGLRERLNDLYLQDVRRLRERQRAGEIALRDYGAHVEALRRGYPLLALPDTLWEEAGA